MPDFAMAKDHSETRHRRRAGGAPLMVAIAVAILGVFGIVVVDYYLWKPKVQPAVVAIYNTTGEAAQAAGARVDPTEPKLQVEPDPAGPKPVHPVNPESRQND